MNLKQYKEEIMADITSGIVTLKDAVAEFEAQYNKYTVEGINAAGSRSRKALMVAKKSINALRKTILADQKVAKAEKKATKVAKTPATDVPAVETPAETAAPTAGKTGKKGKSAE